MKVLLQDVRSKLYLSSQGIWTEREDLAHHFGNSRQALDFARNNKLANVQFVVRFEDPEWHQVSPLPILVATLPASTGS